MSFFNGNFYFYFYFNFNFKIAKQIINFQQYIASLYPSTRLYDWSNYTFFPPTDHNDTHWTWLYANRWLYAKSNFLRLGRWPRPRPLTLTVMVFFLLFLLIHKNCKIYLQNTLLFAVDDYHFVFFFVFFWYTAAPNKLAFMPGPTLHRNKKPISRTGHTSYFIKNCCFSCQCSLVEDLRIFLWCDYQTR